MRTYNELKADVIEARNRIASLRSEMLEGIRQEIIDNGGKITLAGELLDEGVEYNEREMLDISAIEYQVDGRKEPRIAYRAVHTDKTTPLYQHLGHNTPTTYYLNLDSLSTILTVVSILEARRK